VSADGALGALPGTTGRRRIYLMRHGHVDYHGPEGKGVPDLRAVPLTAAGEKEALAAGDLLSAVTFDRAVCSGLPRTRRTAELVLSRQRGTPAALSDDLDLEEIKGGSPRGVAREFNPDAIAAMITYMFETASRPGARMGEEGEFFADALARATGAIERLLHSPGWAHALVVAHEGINRLLLSWIACGGLAAVKVFEQDTACINIIDADMVPGDGDGPTRIERMILKTANLTAYNAAKHGMHLTSLEHIFLKR